ncbi:MAG: tetratricopeptide repeat protein [Candidatus Omnitrophota bacterium]
MRLFKKRSCFITMMAAIFLVVFCSANATCGENGIDKRIAEIDKKIVDGDYQQAFFDAKELVAFYPEESGSYMTFGLVNYALMKYSIAWEYFEKSLKKNRLTKDREKLLTGVLAKMEENRDVLSSMESGEKSLQSAVDTVSDILRVKITKGHFMMLSGFLEEKYYYPVLVLPHINWLKKNAVDVPGLYRLSAGVYYSAMLYQEAAADYEKAVKAAPEDAELFVSFGDCEVALGRFDKARENYKNAIDLYKSRGINGNDIKIRRLKEIMQALPERYEDISELIKNKKFSLAEALCRERISLNPADYAALTQLGMIYWQEKKRPAAIKLFRRAVKIAPDYPIAHLLLGKAYFFEQKPEKGLAQIDIFQEKMEKLPKLDENSTDHYVDDLHYICYMYSTLKRYRDAKKICGKIIKLRPDDQRAHYNMAVCYYMHYHNLSKAYSELQKVIQLDESSRIADMAKYYIDYMRRNPDPRSISDFSFVYEE